MEKWSSIRAEGKGGIRGRCSPCMSCHESKSSVTGSRQAHISETDMAMAKLESSRVLVLEFWSPNRCRKMRACLCLDQQHRRAEEFPRRHTWSSDETAASCHQPRIAIHNEAKYARSAGRIVFTCQKEKREKKKHGETGNLIPSPGFPHRPG